MNQGLTGGQKALYFFAGFFLTWIGILIAWLVNKDKDQAMMKEAIKFAIIGTVVVVVLYIVLFGVGIALGLFAASNGLF